MPVASAPVASAPVSVICNWPGKPQLSRHQGTAHTLWGTPGCRRIPMALAVALAVVALAVALAAASAEKAVAAATAAAPAVAVGALGSVENR